MATEVRSWKANDGSLHETECAAATRDVELIVEQSPLSENSPYAKKLVEWLTANAALIRETLEAHESACPKAMAEKPYVLSLADEGTPGVTTIAKEADLKPHMKSCKARQSGWFRHCSCGAFSTAQIEEFKRQSDAAFPERTDGR